VNTIKGEIKSNGFYGLFGRLEPSTKEVFSVTRNNENTAARNAEIYEDVLKKRLEQQELLLRLSSNFISEGNMSSLVNEALRSAGEFLGAERVLISAVNAEKGVSQVNFLWHSSETIVTFPAVKGLCELMTVSFPESAYPGNAPTILCSDISAVEKYRALGAAGVKSFIWAPIYVMNKYWGVLSIEECHRTREWSEGDAMFVSLVSNIVSAAVARDITEKKLLRMSSIVENSPQFICHTLEDGTLDYVNKSACTLFSYTIDEVMNGGLWLFFDDETKIRLRDHHMPLVRKKGMQGFVAPMKGADGKTRMMRMSMFAIPSGGFGIIGKDDTEKIRFERERADALEQAKRASKAKSDFLANMSHEMRTPMNAIIGMTAIAKTSDEIGRKDYCLSKIGDASKHLLGVINDILDMSKIEANKLELSPIRFNFEKMLQKAVNVVNFRVDEKGQDLTVHVDRNIPIALVGDDQRLTQVVANLLSNAVKFTPERGAVRLDSFLEKEEDGLCTIRIEVSDNGIGISPEQQIRLFSSFEQADRGMSRKFGGTGLGLAISKRIVELMGGKIWVKSELGSGATFAFTVKAERVSEEARSMLNPGVNWTNLRLLVVDDERDTRDYFKDIASRLGVACDVAESGREACGMVDKNGPYDIYFIDWKMPGMNGMELSRRIKGMKQGNSVVIMISATEWYVIEDDARTAGVDKFLPKPLFISSVADCINECIGTDTLSETAGAISLEPGCFEGYRVLLAEDVEVNREILLALLEPTSLSIDCAENGEEALRLFKAAPNAYDLIFMDVQMPEMDGLETTRRIRASGETSAESITIVAMTANVFREDVERCLECGMNDHVGKPIDFDDVLGKLRKYLPLRRNNAAPRP
jgi:PAS domain S-box-containing protein